MYQQKNKKNGMKIFDVNSTVYVNVELCVERFHREQKKIIDYLKPFYFSGFLFAKGKASSMTSMIFFHFNSGTF